MDYPPDFAGLTPVETLAVGVHPDDVELGCAGTVLKLRERGRSVAILDLTRGELGSRGTPELRLEEAHAAARILGVEQRANLGLRDGWFGLSEEEIRAVIVALRAFRPQVVLANAPQDRHPDHGRAAELVRTACFLSGLRRIVTEAGGKAQQPWRPPHVYQYIQDRLLTPSFVVDVTPYFEKKLAAVRAFTSQFYDPNSTEPQTYISTPEFWHGIEARARQMGHFIGATYGEGFVAVGPIEADLPPGL